jgi:uracil-DNA glycosylase
VSGGYRAALTAFLDATKGGWAALPFFAGSAAPALMARLDDLAASGQRILPMPSDVFNALAQTPLENVRVVILGQDPYPTPGDAHGLAFSVNHGVPVPRSLANIFKERESDLGLPRPSHGHLDAWARQGVLLLNACLTVEAGKAGSHRGLGWEALTDQMIRAVSDRVGGAIFVLWGADAQKKRGLIEAGRHPVIESPHPSPLSARRGFFGSRPFSRINAHLAERGLPPVEWSL